MSRTHGRAPAESTSVIQQSALHRLPPDAREWRTRWDRGIAVPPRRDGVRHRLRTVELCESRSYFSACPSPESLPTMRAFRHLTRRLWQLPIAGKRYAAIGPDRFARGLPRAQKKVRSDDLRALP